MIPRSEISRNGPTLSCVAYGTWRLLNDAPTVQEINRRLNVCADLGITTIDTAEVYGKFRVEAALGRALALSPGLRDRLEFVTKSGIYPATAANPDPNLGFYDASAGRILRSIEQSLRFLGTDRLELYLVHRPDWLTGVDDTADGLNAAVSSGKARSVGVSNYSITQYEALASRTESPLVTNQVKCNLLHMDPIYDGTFDMCQRRRIRPMVWSPLGGGRLFDRCDPAAERLAQTAAAISAKYGDASLEQLAYAWIMAHPSRPLPVIGTNNRDRIESAAQAALIVLEREDWYALWVAARGHKVP